MDNIVITYASKLGHSLFLEGSNLVLVSAEDIVLYPRDTLLINTGITLYLTSKYSGILINRPIQAANKIMMPMAGLVYNGICDNIQVMLSNLSSEPYKIKEGSTKLASIQLVNFLGIGKPIQLDMVNNDK